jgi:metal-responsive CopG/Arc/MetJ family transcriptional regulator
MKAIQITFDERLLEKLDRDEEVQQKGRSAVIRHAVADYLRKKRRATIADAYRRAYGQRPAESDFGGWADEGVWPDE